MCNDIGDQVAKDFGFADTRGTLFFEIERIIKAKQPKGFILENVEGLVKHGLEHKNDPIGRNLKTILHVLKSKSFTARVSKISVAAKTISIRGILG